MKNILILLALAFGATTQAADSCNGEFALHVQDEVKNLQRAYSEKDSAAIITPINQTFYKEGNEKLVFLIHGFMGSPDEMRPIAEKLNAQGYAVYAPLIPGMGATADIANTYTKEIWQNWMSTEMAKATQCFSQIYFVGFSTGGTLWNDYLHIGQNADRLAAGVLLSPYFKTHSTFEIILQRAASVFLTHLDVALLFKTLHFPEVLIMLQKPESYMHDVPLKMTQEIVDLGALDQSYTNNVDAPTLVMNSADDALVNQTVTEQVTSTLTHRTYHQYKTNPHTPHHLMVPGYSPVADEVVNNTVNFILWH